jgi:ECF transporter S component (folate family)
LFTERFNTKKLVMVSLFIALQIILSRFLSIQTPWVRIGFNFLPLSLCGIVFGPLTGGIAAALADFIGIVLFPAAGASFFPGYTLTTFMAGATYGLAAKYMGVTPISMLMAVSTVRVGINLLIDTYWLKIILGQGYLALLPQRAFTSLIMIPIQVAVILLVWRAVRNQIPKRV